MKEYCFLIFFMDFPGFYVSTNRFASGDHFIINQLLPNMPTHFREGRQGVSHHSFGVICLLLLSGLLKLSSPKEGIPP